MPEKIIPMLRGCMIVSLKTQVNSLQNTLNKGQCYLPEAVKKYAEKYAYLKDFMKSILKDLK